MDTNVIDDVRNSFFETLPKNISSSITNIGYVKTMEVVPCSVLGFCILYDTFT
jgi:hypothetical protein